MSETGCVLYFYHSFSTLKKCFLIENGMLHSVEFSFVIDTFLLPFFFWEKYASI